MSHQLATSDAELARVVGAAREAKTIALDTEFMRERTYRARLCLIQIATPDEVILIDPIDGVDLAPVGELVADHGIEVVVHAGRQDLEIFFERFGAEPHSIFDVQIAAAFAGLGASLPYGRLVQDVTGTRLAKGEGYTDWCRRPLTDKQLGYAVNDVAYLLGIAAELKRRLEEQERLEWALEEMRMLEDPSNYDLDLDEIYRKVGGRGSLSGRQLTVLRQVARWREETARRRDIPRGWVIKDPTLIEIARRAPQSVDELSRIRGMNAQEAQRSGAAIMSAIEEGHRSAEMKPDKAPSRSAQIRARMLSGPADAIVRARCEEAAIATELVATRPELESLLADVTVGTEDLSRHRLMRGWRRSLAGDHVVAFARGEVAIKATDDSPFVEEIVI
ncbi:MAG: ribonuclease D [Actinomycetota bacterium]